MAYDRPRPAADRLLVAKLTGVARRHAQWGTLDDAQKAAGVAELREAAGDRADLLAEVAGVALGTTERKGPEYGALGQGVAELCRLAVADETLIPEWIEEGRRRAEAAQRPPFSGGVRPSGRPAMTAITGQVPGRGAGAGPGWQRGRVDGAWYP
jgi:hypothetical protein